MNILLYKTLGTHSSLSLGQMSLRGTDVNSNKIIIPRRLYQFTPSPIVNESVCFLQSFTTTGRYWFSSEPTVLVFIILSTGEGEQ